MLLLPFRGCHIVRQSIPVHSYSVEQGTWGATADLHTARVVSGRSTLAAERLHNMPVHSTNSTIVVTSLHRDCTHHGLNACYGVITTVTLLRFPLQSTIPLGRCLCLI